MIASCAVRALGGEMQGRLWARDERDESIALGEGLTIGKKLTLDDLCASQYASSRRPASPTVSFSTACYRRGSAYTQSIIISTYSRSIRTIDARHELRPRDLQVDPIAPRTGSTAG